MSFGASFDRCDISAKVFVKSTNESLPSSADSRRTDKCWTPDFRLSGGDVRNEDSIEGT